MANWLSVAPTILASFMASLVEFVEALSIVLAVALVRGWRSALLGTAAALLVLAALVAGLGSSLARIPLFVAQIAIGTLLLMFGMRWLRKAILRASGLLALHDEEAAFSKETDKMRRAVSGSAAAFDQLAFVTSFKIVMLEGIEVVFIVIAIGAGGPLIGPAVLGAALALLVVVLLGWLLNRPLAKVPENSLKFMVGVLLSAFGSFWIGEGSGFPWPGQDWAILALIVCFLLTALLLVKWCAGRSPRTATTATSAPAKQVPNKLLLIAQELFGLFVDDAWSACMIVAWVAFAWLAASGHLLAGSTLCIAFAMGVVSILALTTVRRARSLSFASINVQPQ